MSKNDLAKIIGDNIRAKREEWPSGWSQVFLAERAGINATMLAHYEAGDRVPTLETLIKISKALYCTLDQLVNTSKSWVTVTDSWMYRAERALGIVDSIKRLIER